MGLFKKKQVSIPVSSATIEETNTYTNQTYSDSNRLLCYNHLQTIFTSSEGASKGVVLKLYIENFKRLNDVFGYDYCEKLLEQIIVFLRESSGLPVYRYIGVEFIMILEQFTQSQATDLAEDILEQFDHVWKINDTDCLCSVQIGMSSYPGYAADTDGLLKCLDLAVSKASDIGPNQSVFYDSVLQNQNIRRRNIALYLQTALEKKEIEVRYRPTFSISKGRFTRAEYYMRIFIKGIGLIGSAEFLPIAEDSGQIRSLEYFALAQVGACIADLLAAGKEFDSIALPISPVLFLQEDFLDEIESIIQKYQIPRGKLAIEIQENALTTAYLNINVMLQTLSELGVELILNDFGSGYSSITSIFELPVNTLKLERMFVWQLETNEDSAYVIDGLIQIAKNLNLNIIAEGIETDNQVTKLTDYGCEYQQGFYYAPTIDEAVLLQVIDSTLEESQQILTIEKEKLKNRVG